MWQPPGSRPASCSTARPNPMHPRQRAEEPSSSSRPFPFSVWGLSRRRHSGHRRLVGSSGVRWPPPRRCRSPYRLDRVGLQRGRRHGEHQALRTNRGSYDRIVDVAMTQASEARLRRGLSDRLVAVRVHGRVPCRNPCCKPEHPGVFRRELDTARGDELKKFIVDNADFDPWSALKLAG